MSWRYFGRTGGTGRILDVYRLPADSFQGAFDFAHFRAMERLLPDGRWVSGQGGPAEKEWVDGWFDEENEISEADAQKFAAVKR